VNLYFQLSNLLSAWFSAGFAKAAHTRYQKFSYASGIINENTVGQEFWHVTMKMLITVMYMAIVMLIKKGRKFH
jgi:hypothetical protein